MKSDQELRELHDGFHDLFKVGPPKGFPIECHLMVGTCAAFLCFLTDCTLPSHSLGKSHLQQMMELALPAANEKRRETRFREN